MVEHRIRLENGTKAFERMDKAVSEIDKRITPKPPSVLKIISTTIGCFVVLASALWGLSVMMSDRPTTSQVKDIMLDHDRHGHAELRSGMSEMETSIKSQEQLIQQIKNRQDEIRDAQTATSAKIDDLIKRTRRNH
jgi:hypothetical protein